MRTIWNLPTTSSSTRLQTGKTTMWTTGIWRSLSTRMRNPPLCKERPQQILSVWACSMDPASGAPRMSSFKLSDTTLIYSTIWVMQINISLCNTQELPESHVAWTIDNTSPAWVSQKEVLKTQISICRVMRYQSCLLRIGDCNLLSQISLS